MNGVRRAVRVAHLMGMPISIHVRTDRPDDDAVDAAAARCWTLLREIDQVFSPYRPDSDVSRIRREELDFSDADPWVAQVATACEQAARVTGGRFSAYWDGRFDPTGYVKGWAVERAARAFLEPLLEHRGVQAAGINAGGDMQLFTADAADRPWRIGVEDPSCTGRLTATVDVRNGAVATSGIAQRGCHVRDPRTGSLATDVLSATVVCDSLTDADVWATAAVAAGAADRLVVGASRSGVLVAADGTRRRWADGVEITGQGEADTIWPATATPAGCR